MNTQIPQLVYIHGGMTFENETDYRSYLESRTVSIEKKIRWSDAFLDSALWSDFHIIRPRMPLQDNAKYTDWKIHFEKHFEHLNDGVVLVWESLWGVFLAKYLSEHQFPKKIATIILVCPPHDNTLIWEDLVGGFELGDNLSKIEENGQNVVLFFSQDDDCVPVGHAEKYKSKLPSSSIVIFESKNWHFNIPEFPEIIQHIKEQTRDITQTI